MDIVPIKKDAAGWKELWNAPQTTCPKVLETKNEEGEIVVMKLCNSWVLNTPYNGTAHPDPFGTDEAMYPLSWCIHLGNSYKR